MKLQLTESQLDEAEPVLLVLIQAYSDQLGSGVTRSHCDEMSRALTLVFADVAQTRDGATLPIHDLIREFAKTNQIEGSRFSVVVAPSPFAFNASSEVKNFKEIELALAHFGETCDGLKSGWAALIDTHECRLIGEVSL